MVGGPISIALASRMNRRNCSRVILSTSRTLVSPSDSYSLKSACNAPACVNSETRAAATSSALASFRESAMVSLTNSGIPKASKSSRDSSHRNPGVLWVTPTDDVLVVSFVSPESARLSRPPNSAAFAGGVPGRPSQRAVNASGPRPNRTTTPSPSAYRARITESTSSTIPSRFITACGTNVPEGRFAKCAARSHAANASHRKICSPFPQSMDAVATSPVVSFPNASVGRRLTLSCMVGVHGCGTRRRANTRLSTTTGVPADLTTD
mmetsp:Transcript_13260/g.43941  ORF Transcript_13260/g.43941 Transcript_13260/m.43941 type:complete len:266 (+) Transcript_13260:1292-2089(+)